MKFFNLFLKLFYFLFLFFNVDLSFSKEENIDEVIAVVNEDIILKSDLDNFFDIFKKNNKKLIKDNFNKKDLYIQYLNKLITDKIILQYARKEKINFSNKYLDDEFDKIAFKYGFSIDEFKKKLVLNKIDIEEYKNDILKRKIIEQLFNRKILSKIKISQEELSSYLFRSNAQINQESYLNLSHIYIPLSFNLSNLDFKSIEKFVYKILNDARNGISFFDLKKKYSEFFFLGYENVGWNKLKNLPKIFFHRLKYAKKKDIVGPIISDYGFHILKIKDIKYKKNFYKIVKLKIKYIFISHSNIFSKKKNYEKIKKILTEIKNEKITFLEALKKYSENSDFNIGDKKGAWVPINDYHFSIRNVLKFLKKGEISEPIFLNSGWYLIKVEDKKLFNEIHYFNEEEIFNWLFKKKFNEEIENWIRNKNKCSYITIFDKNYINYYE